MHFKPKRHSPLRPLSPLLLTLALGGCGLPEEPQPSESPATQAQGLALPPGLAPALVKDIQVGHVPFHGMPGSFPWGSTPVSTGSKVYFRAWSDSVGEELWSTDGTEAGTQLVRDLTPGQPGSSFNEMATVGESVFLNLYSYRGLSNSLWKSDGTAEGTFQVRTATEPVQNAQSLVSCNGQLFFTRMTSWGGSELWKTAGTPAGTVLLNDSVRFDYYMPGFDSPPLVCADGTLFFVGSGSSWDSRELWKSDGTAQGTRYVGPVGIGTNSVPGGGPVLLAHGSRVFLNTADDLQPLWTSDGTPEGTRALGPAGQLPWPSLLGVRDGNLFFTTFDYGRGYALWKSDGTDVGTQQVKHLTQDPNSFFMLTSLLLGDTFLFSEGPTLVMSDGTTEGTVLLKDNVGLAADFLTRGGEGAALTNGRMLFAGMEGYSWPPRLWVSDGTAAGTVALQTAQGQIPSWPTGVRSLGDRVVFWADDGKHGMEPWVTDGTPAGTRMVRDIFRVNASNPQELTDVDGTLFFVAYDAQNHYGLWKSDGTAEGSVLLKALDPVTWASPQRLTRAGNTLFFFSDLSGFSLWKSDGTPEGTVQVRHLGSGSHSSLTRATAVGSTLFFNLHEATTGMELWKSDGTAEGTVLVKDIRPGTAGAGVTKLTAVGNTLFFIASDGVHGSELWKTDGTAKGTVLVKDIRPGAGGSDLYDLTEVEGVLYFSAEDGVHGREPWKSDGTAEGTALLKDIRPGSASPFPSAYSYWPRPACLYGIGDTLYLAADDGVHGSEPWKSDGTAEGTVLLRDVMPGPLGSGVDLEYAPNTLGRLTAFVPVGPRGGVAFAASNGVKGLEPWVTDGTTAGTRQLADVAPGAMSASPSLLTVSGPRLFFVADEGVHGRELWSVKHAAFKSR